MGVRRPPLARRALARRPRALRGVVARAGRAVLPRLGYEVTRVTPGSVLVSHASGGSRDWMAAEKELSDRVEHTQIAALLAQYRVNCVLDVGAHRGQFAEKMRAAGYRGHILSFEPVPEVYERLARAAADDERWTVRQLALGREDGTVRMNVVGGTLSSLLPATEFGAGRYPRLREPTPTTVELRRLDGLLDELLAPVAGPRPYLKLDTQGYDLEVFAGLGERAADFVGMQSEVPLKPVYEGSPRLCEALATYEAAGFEVAGLYPVSRQSRTARMVEYDCVLVRADALARSWRPPFLTSGLGVDAKGGRAPG